MTRPLSVLAGVLSFGIAVTPALAAQAQESPARAPRFELSVLIAHSRPSQDGTYTSSYTPPLAYFDHSGNAGQTLSVAGSGKTQFAAGAAYFVHPRIGVQVLVNRFSSDLFGANGPYAVSLRYPVFFPPDWVPIETLYERAGPWPDTEGELTNLAVAANAVARFGEGAVRAQLSGGPSLFRTSGRLRSLGYTRMWLWGYDALYLSESELELSIEPQTKLGFNAGGEVTVVLAPSAALLFDARYFWAPTSSNSVRVLSIINRDEVFDPAPIADIEQQMALQPIAIAPSFLRLAFGLKIFW